MDTWYALITDLGKIDSFLSGDEVNAEIVRRYAPSGWALDRLTDADLIAKLDAAVDRDDLHGIPISSLLHEACLASGCGLN